MTAALPVWRAGDTCVLDMDGTLLDLHFDNQVWNQQLPRQLAAQRGLSLTAASEEVRRSLASQRDSLLWYCMEHWSEVFALELSAIEAQLEHLICIRPGVEAFLNFLREREVRLILATNAHPQSLTRKLAVTGIGQYFETIVSAHEFGFAKEHDNFWSLFAERCAIRRETTVFIDDNPRVLAAAQRFGIRHLFGIAQPDSRGTGIEDSGFVRLHDFAELYAPLAVTS